MTSEYSELFTIYTDHSNGKRLVASAVIDIMESNNLRYVLDVGAGNGDLTQYLIPHATRLVAVEPNPKFAQDLESVTAKGQHSYYDVSAENFNWNQGEFDLILMAYVLESMQQASWRGVCTKLLKLLSSRGKLIGVTYVDGCAWDAYATVVEKEIGLDSRSGGISRVFSLLRNIGFNVRILHTASTQIWGNDYDSLYDVLTFFFRRKADLYSDRRSTLLPSLKSIAEPFGSGVCVEVREAVYEITSLPGTSRSHS